MHSFSHKVRNLTDSDFVFDKLKSPNCTLILFYNDINQKDRDIFIIWQSVARSGSSIVDFAAVNLRIYPTLNFYHQDIPIIVVYQNQLLKTFYKGHHEINDIIDFVLTLPHDDNISQNEGLRKYSKAF